MREFLLLVLALLLWAQSSFSQNDNLCDATPITLDVACSTEFNIVLEGSTVEQGEPEVSCLDPFFISEPSNSVWFSFVAPTEPVFISVLGDPADLFSSFQINLFNLVGECGDLSNLSLEACAAPHNLISGTSLLTSLTEGATYYIQVSGTVEPPFIDDQTGDILFPGSTFAGSGCLSIATVMTPTNDNVCDATSLEINADPLIQSNLGATAEDSENIITPGPTDDPLFGIGPGWAPGTDVIDHSVWYTFTTPPEGGNITVDLSNASGFTGGFNTQLAIYFSNGCADFNEFTLVEAADNFFGDFGLSVNPKIDLFCLEGGVTYYVLVDGGATFGFQPIPDQGLFAIQVTAPEVVDISVNSVSEGESCPDAEDGTIAFTAMGGAGGYSYLWSDGATIPHRVHDLPAGDYTVTITDMCGATLTEGFTVSSDRSEEELAVVTGPDITANEGAEVDLKANVNGGVPFDRENLFVQDFQPETGLFNIIRTQLSAANRYTVIAEDLDVQYNEVEFVGNELYATDFSNNLYVIDAESGSVSLITQLDVSGVDLSYVPSEETLVLLSRTGQAFEVDLNTGELSLIGERDDFGFILHAVVDDDGVLYAFVTENFDRTDFISVDLFTGEKEVITEGIDGPVLSFRGLERDPNDGKFYTSQAFTTTQEVMAEDPFRYFKIFEISKGTGEILKEYNNFNDGITGVIAFKESDGLPYQVYWEPAELVDDPTSVTPTFVGDETTLMTVTVEDACGNTSEASVEVEILTGCHRPGNVRVVSSGSGRNRVVWGRVADARSYEIRLKLLDNGAETVIPVRNRRISIFTASGRAYSVSVRAVCRGGERSGFSDPITIGSVSSGAITAETRSIDQEFVVEELNDVTSINVSPNPFNQILKVETVGLNETSILRMYDILGRLKMEKTVTKGIQEINLDLSDLTEGVYVFMISNGTEIIHQERIIKTAH